MLALLPLDSVYVLAQLLSGGSINQQLYHGMATAVGIATGVGSMVANWP